MRLKASNLRMRFFAESADFQHLGRVLADRACPTWFRFRQAGISDDDAEQVTEYGITSHAPGQYEVDHLVSLELGGSNDIANLWPELASPKPGFHEKDKVENYLHAQVCSALLAAGTAGDCDELAGGLRSDAEVDDC